MFKKQIYDKCYSNVMKEFFFLHLEITFKTRYVNLIYLLYKSFHPL